MAQFARPTSDLDNTGVWTTEPLWSDIDDGASADGTVVVSDTTPVVTEPFTVDLGTITDPVTSTGHIVRIRWAKNAGGGGAKTIRIELRQGYVNESTLGTLISTDDYSLNSTTLQNDETTLSTGEANSITDYSDLQLRIMGVASNRALKVDFAELEVPDAPTAYTETSTDDVDVTDDTTPVKTITPAVADDADVTDDTTPVKAATQAPADDIGVTDSTTRIAPAVREVIEPVGVTELVSPAKSTTVEITEAIGVTDGSASALTITRIITGPVGVTDLTTKSETGAEEVVEAVGVTDSVLHVDPTLQFIYPDGDILSGGWETAPTAGQPLADQIDEDPSVDTDYIFEEV